MNYERLLRAVFSSFLTRRSAFCGLLVVWSFAYWFLVIVFLTNPASAYRLPSEYMGDPGTFISNFTNEIKEYFDDYFGLLVSFVGVRYVLRAFLG